MATRLTLTHVQRIELYVKLITERALPLTPYKVALMRNAAPSQAELDALNSALQQLEWLQ